MKGSAWFVATSSLIVYAANLVFAQEEIPPPQYAQRGWSTVALGGVLPTAEQLKPALEHPRPRHRHQVARNGGTVEFARHMEQELRLVEIVLAEPVAGAVRVRVRADLAVPVSGKLDVTRLDGDGR